MHFSIEVRGKLLKHRRTARRSVTNVDTFLQMLLRYMKINSNYMLSTSQLAVVVHKFRQYAGIPNI